MSLQSSPSAPSVQNIKPPRTFVKSKPPAFIMAEDNLLNVKVARALLSQMGYSLDVAFNGRLLVEQMLKKDYDLVFMDISMPEMDGYEATHCIRSGLAGERHKEVPVIAVSALCYDEVLMTGMDVGIDSVISKPLRAAVLAEHIARFIRVIG